MALPVELASGRVSFLRMVSISLHFGLTRLQTVDEHGNERNVKGYVAEAHKPMESRSEIKHHDAPFFQESGVLIPNHGQKIRGLRQECHRLC